ncbi:MAG TPA: tetratricopeptide repeat protein [Opitutaceae bacterium]|nr:tetratricopeptide repeat protein [Opitutaceae bacterium]
MTFNSSREEELFHRALALPADQRAAFLERECAGDPALRRAVESLLRLHTAADGFIEQPAPELASTVVSAALRAEEKPGDWIGRYKLLQQIGEGGCGVVYMAEQEEPVRRRVALKVIKLGMDTKSVIARFEAERQALAMMDHPNIAKVLDAGATENGRPFFVMELVRGVPITKYCDEANLSTAARLELFTSVCHAIQHAHQKGIVHRDVKPSNILVTLHDGEPVAKVIDFGIAKATQGRLTDQTLFTAFEQFIGTPAYMSPEQAEMSGLDIDTRSDIYSLGVLLYELLTGRPPFDPKTFLAAGLDEMRRIIREVEPPRPSTRLSTLTDSDRSTIAKLRGALPAQLSTLLSGDLDWIVMKALEKNRTRRYESASAFAADIERHLHNEPVVARPPSTAYLLQKLIRRHRLAFATGTAIACALVLGLAMATWAFVREKAAREQAVDARNNEARQRSLAEAARASEAKQRLAAEANEQKAKTEAARSEQAFKFMAGMLEGVGPSAAAGRDTTLLREILDKTNKRLDQALKDQPEVEANLRGILGGVYLDLGEVTKAEAMALDAVAKTKKLHGHEHADVAEALGTLGVVRFTQGRVPEAEALMQEALAILQKLPDDQAHGKASALYGLAATQQSQGKLIEAEASLRQALTFARKDPNLENSRVDDVLMLLGNVLMNEGRLAEAEPMIREALGDLKRSYGGEHPQVGIALTTLSYVLQMQGKLPEAAATFDEGFALLRKTYGPDHPNTIGLRFTHAMLLQQQGKLPEAESLLREILAQQKKVFGPENERAAKTLQVLIHVLQQEGKGDEAAALQPESAAKGKNAPNGPDLAEVSAKMNRAMSTLSQGKLAEGEAGVREALALAEKTNGPANPNVIQIRQVLAQVVLQQSRSAEAETIMRDVLAVSREAFGNNSTYVANALLFVARTCEAQDKLAETEASLREMLAIAKTFTTDGENFNVANAMLLLAAIRARLGDTTEASLFVKDAATMSAKLTDRQRDLALNAADSMAAKLRKQGKPDDAEAVDRVTLEFARRRDGPESATVALIQVHRADAMNKARHFAEAEPIAREGWELRKKILPPTDWAVAIAQGILGQSLLGLKKYPEAEAALLAASADLQNKSSAAEKTTGPWKTRQQEVMTALAWLYRETNQPDKAAEWQQALANLGAAPAAAKK